MRRKWLQSGALIAGLSLSVAACSGGGTSEGDSGTVETTEAASTAEPAEEAPPAPTTGIVTGALTYPGDYIPDDMQACAENLDTKEVTCKPKTGEASYSLELPAGRYHIWSQTADFANYKAYYNPLAKCGLGPECPTDSTPLEVEVKAGETLSDIDPIDWYSN
ncbi:MAG: hypothetical protein H6918_10135 [Sphingomonadaceae bacterium]|nr:hypothetical protein [Sphingomonadaceae bacterium]